MENMEPSEFMDFHYHLQHDYSGPKTRGLLERYLVDLGLALERVERQYEKSLLILKLESPRRYMKISQML